MEERRNTVQTNDKESMVGTVVFKSISKPLKEIMRKRHLPLLCSLL